MEKSQRTMSINEAFSAMLPLSRKRLQFLIRSRILFVKNLLFRRRLAVSDVDILESIILRGSDATISWKTVGCHRILVRALGEFPGDSNGVTFPSDRVSPILEIVFSGVRETVSKTLDLNLINLEMRDVAAFVCLPRLRLLPTTPKVMVTEISSSWIAKISGVAISLSAQEIRFPAFNCAEYASTGDQKTNG